MTARAASGLSATALGVFAAALPNGSTRAGTLKTTKPN